MDPTNSESSGFYLSFLCLRAIDCQAPVSLSWRDALRHCTEYLVPLVTLFIGLNLKRVSWTVRVRRLQGPGVHIPPAYSPVKSKNEKSKESSADNSAFAGIEMWW